MFCCTRDRFSLLLRSFEELKPHLTAQASDRLVELLVELVHAEAVALLDDVATSKPTPEADRGDGGGLGLFGLELGLVVTPEDLAGVQQLDPDDIAEVVDEAFGAPVATELRALAEKYRGPMRRLLGPDGFNMAFLSEVGRRLVARARQVREDEDLREAS